MTSYGRLYLQWQSLRAVPNSLCRRSYRQFVSGMEMFVDDTNQLGVNSSEQVNVLSARFGKS